MTNKSAYVIIVNRKGVLKLTNKKLSVKNLCLCGLMAALIAICSWISIPIGEVPITLQTFAVFLTVGLLGGKLGSISVLVYVLLGAVGVPVFAGFTGGIGVILGTTGGYIVGFIFSALVIWLIEHVFGKKPLGSIIAMIVGLAVCYAIGTVWFMAVYTHNTGAVGLGTVLGWCVIPFIIPDIIKIALAFIIANRVSKHVHITA